MGVVATVVGVVSAGCGSAPAGFDAADPTQRLDASISAAARRDPEAVPDLIRLLDSDDPAVRLVAIRALERITGLTQGYDYAAPEAERAQAIERWVRWVEQGRDQGQASPSRQARSGDSEP